MANLTEICIGLGRPFKSVNSLMRAFKVIPLLRRKAIRRVD